MGFLHHTADEAYWNESAAYVFNMREVETIERATNRLHEICCEAAETIIQRDWFQRLKLSVQESELIASSWENDERSLFGRFDLSWDGQGEPAMLEYNADTPTSLFEASIVQWEWLVECKPGKDQFNSIHEKLKNRWAEIAQTEQSLHFMCMRESAEDIVQTEYLRDVAHQAGFNTKFLFLDELGWHENEKFFVDIENLRVSQAFKLYPWEWIVRDEFSSQFTSRKLKLFEPAWKRLLSTKAILPILWELYPNHPNLLASTFDAPVGGSYVRKPAVSREGQRVTIFENSKPIFETAGNVESVDFIYQDNKTLPQFGGNFAVIGAWIVGEEAAGMGIREDFSLVTGNTSRFVPHYIEGA